MSNAEVTTWENHWLTPGERKALLATEAERDRWTRLYEGSAVGGPVTTAALVDLTLRRSKAQQAKRRARLTMTGYVLCGAAVPFIVGGYLWLIAG